MEQICIAVIVCCMSYSGVLDSGNCKEFSKSQMLALSVLSGYLHLGNAEGLHNTKQVN